MSRAHLENLEKEGVYLFHGSSQPALEVLEPRQSYTIPEGQSERVLDGEPAVAASPYIDIAIFRALVHGESSFTSSVSGDKPAQLSFIASKEALQEAKQTKGYIYVLSRDAFSPRGHEKGMEWRAHEPVKPLEIVEVDFEDLPQQLSVG